MAFCKVLVIAFLKSSVDEPARYLVVKDKRHGEWSFITGGCRPSTGECEGNHGPARCAARELLEETMGTVRTSPEEVSKIVPVRVRDGTPYCKPCTYHVCLVPIDGIFDDAPRMFERRMKALAKEDQENIENTEIRWVTQQELVSLKPKWQFMEDMVHHEVIQSVFDILDGR